MGEFTAPFLVKPFCAIMAADEGWLVRAREALVSRWGAIDLESSVFQVEDYTPYYQHDMAPRVLKQFLSLATLQTVEEMNHSAKFWSNSVEDKLRETPGQRSVNLDPGYLTLDKFVLYTTKNFAHRLYIRDGLFAEITLSYKKKSGHYEAFSHTYPDYRTPEARQFFLSMRHSLASAIIP